MYDSLLPKKFGSQDNLKMGHKRFRRKNKNYWSCICDCGKQLVVRGDQIRTSTAKSCGCLQKERAAISMAKTFSTHGLTGTKLYRVWASMKQRCYDTKNAAYKNRNRNHSY